MMQAKTVQQHIFEYLDLLRRGKYFIIVPVTIALILGCAVAWKLPPIYRSEVKMMYTESQIPKTAVMQTVNIYLEAMIIFIEALTFNHENSLKLIEELDLYPEMVRRLPMDVVISHMKKSYGKELVYTNIQGPGGGKTQEIVSGIKFYFEHPNPKKAFQVANALEASFLVNYKSFRERFTSQTTTFFEDERDRLKEEIVQLDERISKFKEEHVNELPELFQMNYRMVDMLSTQIFNFDQRIQMMRGQRMNLELSMSTINPIIGMSGISGQRIVTPVEKLAALKAELGLLLSTYSEKHPTVIRTRKEIESLEEQVAEEQAKKGPERSGEDSSGGPLIKQLIDQGTVGAYNPAYLQMLTRLEQIDTETEALSQQKLRAEEELREFERRVGVTPQVEREYKLIRRDLTSAQQRYKQLSDQVLNLQSAEALEKREMGGKLMIAQPAVFPLSPFKPNRPMIVGIALAVGLLLGVLMLLGWNFLTETVRFPQEASELVGAPLLMELPLIAVEKGVTPGKRFAGLYLRVGVIALIVATIFLVDTFYIEVDVLFAKVLSSVKSKLMLMGF